MSDESLHLLIRSYLDDLQPRTEAELAAVESMVGSEWLTWCVQKFEKDLFDEKIRDLRLEHPEAEFNTLLALAFLALSEEGAGLDFIGRVQDHLDRDYEDALKTFRRLRKKQKFPNKLT